MPTRPWLKPALAAVAIASHALCANATASSYSSVVVFGDSLSDAGNVYAATSVSPIPPFTDPTPLSPPYFVGRFSNGPNYADVLAMRLGAAQNPIGLNPSLLPNVGLPFPYGSNYAWGGANTGPAVIPVSGLSTPPIFRADLPGPGELPSQLQLFASTLPSMTADPNALYVLWGGGNDLRDALKYVRDHPETAGTTGAAVVAAAVGYLGGALATLDALGAQHVLVANAPDLSLTPETHEWDAATPFDLGGYASALSASFNQGLGQLLASAATQGLDIIPFDVAGTFNEVLANPAAFGITNTTQPCLTTGELSIFIGGAACASPATMVWWDNHHPSATMHAIFGERMYLAAVPEPATYALLLAGLWAVGLAARRGVSSRPSPRARPRG